MAGNGKRLGSSCLAPRSEGGTSYPDTNQRGGKVDKRARSRCPASRTRHHPPVHFEHQRDDLLMPDSNPPSPGARSRSDDEAERPPDPEVEDEEDSGITENRTFWTFYQKKYYEVPSECVKADYGKPMPVTDGAAMGVIHECKSHPLWLKAGAQPGHLVLLEADIGGGTLQRGLYVTFCVRGQASDDPFVLRPLHKSIAKKFYETWTSGDDKWDEPMRNRYAKLIEEEPPNTKQISPVSCHWKEVPKAGEPKVLYRRKPGRNNDDEDGDGPGGKQPPAKKQKKEAPALQLASDDDASHPESSSIVTQPSFAMGGAQMGGGGSSVNVFPNTPGMVTVDLAEWQKLNAFYYSNGGGR